MAATACFFSTLRPFRANPRAMALDIKICGLK
ncbi:MAG: N-(5'-phosphoribosyl)anthranilate isomerase, partial [Mesorhizobium sp.]